MNHSKFPRNQELIRRQWRNYSRCNAQNAQHEEDWILERPDLYSLITMGKVETDVLAPTVVCGNVFVGSEKMNPLEEKLNKADEKFAKYYPDFSTEKLINLITPYLSSYSLRQFTDIEFGFTAEATLFLSCYQLDVLKYRIEIFEDGNTFCTSYKDGKYFNSISYNSPLEAINSIFIEFVDCVQSPTPSKEVTVVAIHVPWKKGLSKDSFNDYSANRDHTWKVQAEIGELDLCTSE